MDAWVPICERPPAMGNDNADQLTSHGRTTAGGLYGKSCRTWEPAHPRIAEMEIEDGGLGRGSSDRARYGGKKEKIGVPSSRAINWRISRPPPPRPDGP